MSLSRRALLLAAGVASLRAGAAEPMRLVCPLAVEPERVIPGLSDRLETRLVGSKIYGGLCRFDEQGVPQPELAAGWDIAPDGLTYVFHLRPGLTWHDSGAVTADDVVFSIDRFHRHLQPGLGLERVTAIRAPDARTVVMTLAVPFASFLHRLDALSAPIVPQHVHDRPGFALDPRMVLPVGTGPFWLGERWRLIRFEWFAGPKTPLVEIACPVRPDLAARLALLDRRTILLVGDAVDAADLPDAALVVDSQPSGTIAGLRLNGSASPLDDVRVRLGLASAIDRPAILRDVWEGQGRVATGPGPANVPPVYDPRQASSYFTQAGLLPDDRGVRLRLSYLVPPGEPWQRLAARLRLMLDHVGVDLTAETVNEAEWTRRVAAGDYQLTNFHSRPIDDLSLDDAAMPMLSARAATLIALVEPGIPVVRDRRLILPGGVFGDFATARLTPETSAAL